MKKENTTTVTTTAATKDFYTKREFAVALSQVTGLSMAESQRFHAVTDPRFHNLTVHEYRMYGRRAVR